jgi:hypothetical protein
LRPAGATQPVLGADATLDVAPDWLAAIEPGAVIELTDARGARRADLEAYQADLMTCGRYATNTVHVKMRSVRRFYD